MVRSTDTQHLHYTSDKRRRWSNHESFCRMEAVPRKMGASIPRLKVRFSVFICGRGSCIRGSHSPRTSAAWSNSPALRLAGNTNTRCRPRCSGAVADIPAFRFSKDKPHRRIRPRTKFSPLADFPRTLPF